MLVDTLDKGGLEQVVVNITRGVKENNVHIFITGKEYGEKGWLLASEGYKVFLLNDDFELFQELTRQNNIKVINSHFSVWNLWGIAEVLKIKLIYTIHNSYTWIEEPVFRKNRKEAYRYVHKFIAVSHTVKDYFSKNFDVERARISVIENGLDTRELSRPKILAKPGKDFIFLNVGTITPLKNQLLLISAFKDLSEIIPNVSLYLVGNNSEEYFDTIKNYLKKYKLTNKVLIVPFVSRREISNLYRSANCFVLSSLQEGCPNVLLESLYFGLPTISTDVGNAKSLLRGLGYLVKNGYQDLSKTRIETLMKLANSENQPNKKELVMAMQNMVKDYYRWRLKSKAMNAYIRSNYNISKMISRYEKIFSS